MVALYQFTGFTSDVLSDRVHSSTSLIPHLVHLHRLLPTPRMSPWTLPPPRYLCDITIVNLVSLMPHVVCSQQQQQLNKSLDIFSDIPAFFIPLDAQLSHRQNSCGMTEWLVHCTLFEYDLLPETEAGIGFNYPLSRCLPHFFMGGMLASCLYYHKYNGPFATSRQGAKQPNDMHCLMQLLSLCILFLSCLWIYSLVFKYDVIDSYTSHSNILFLISHLITSFAFSFILFSLLVSKSHP